MPRNPQGTKEIRALFGSVDDLYQPADGALVSPDGLQLTDRGIKVQRSYENWRAEKLVPSVLKNSPPAPLDAEYVANFLRLKDGGWSSNRAIVRHIFATGFRCPPGLVRDALQPIIPPLQIKDADDPEASRSDVVEGSVAALRDEGRGNSKRYRESANAAAARFADMVLRNVNIAPSETEQFLAKDDREDAQRADLQDVVASLWAQFISGFFGITFDPSELKEDANAVDEIDFRPALQSIGMNVEDITAEALEKNRVWTKALPHLLGRAAARLNENPESISPKVKVVRVLFDFAKELAPPSARPFGVRLDSDEPRFVEMHDTLIIYFAAVATEIAETK